MAAWTRCTEAGELWRVIQNVGYRADGDPGAPATSRMLVVAIAAPHSVPP
jgi:hypothetical protein